MPKRAIISPRVLGVAALLFFAINTGTSWYGGRADQETDDAFVRADMTPLSTRISGTVRKIKIEDFEPVKAGQVLVEIEDDDYRAIVQQAKSSLAASQATLDDNQAAKRIQTAKNQNGEAMVTQAEAAVGAPLAKLRYDLRYGWQCPHDDLPLLYSGCGDGSLHAVPFWRGPLLPLQPPAGCRRYENNEEGFLASREMIVRHGLLLI